MRVYLFVFLIAAAVTYLLTPATRWFAQKTHAVTAIRDRDVHTVPTPRLGGVAIFCGIVAAFLLASQIPFLNPVFGNSREAWAILVAAGLVCLLGVLDDIWDLDAWTKLAGQVLAALVMALSGVRMLSFPVGDLIIGSTRISLVVTVIVVVITINAINFVDGLDGLAAGVVAIGGSAYFLYIYLLLASSSNVPDYASLAALVIAALIGACVGFLPHNFYRARIFMGDSGAMLLGLLLATAAIKVTGQIDPAAVETQSDLVPVFVPVLLPVLLPIAVMLVPIVDLVLAVIRRVGKGKSPFAADRMHLHHRLLNMGHSHRRAVVIMYMWTAVFAYGTTILIVVPLSTAVWIWLAAIAVATVLTVGPLRGRRASARRAAGPGSPGAAPAELSAPAPDQAVAQDGNRPQASAREQADHRAPRGGSDSTGPEQQASPAAGSDSTGAGRAGSSAVNLDETASGHEPPGRSPTGPAAPDGPSSGSREVSRSSGHAARDRSGPSTPEGTETAALARRVVTDASAIREEWL